MEKGLVWDFRVWIYYKRLKFWRFKLKWRVLNFSKTNKGLKYKAEADCLRKFGLSVFPYEFRFKYDWTKQSINFIDGYPCFKYYGFDIFFPKQFSEAKAMMYGNQILLEQDSESPHCYHTDLFCVSENDVLLDIGCGDGNFSLERVGLVKQVYLFESNPEWGEPLKKTFQKWNYKVNLYNQKVGKGDDSIQLSSLNSLIGQNIFVKIDVDGAEREVLKTIDSILDKVNNVKVAICTYHMQRDPEEFEDWFKTRGFRTSFGNGYMLFHYDKAIQEPYFRPGILFAYRT